MKLKDYSLQIKKHIALLLHLVFLTLALGGICVIYLNSQIGSGLSWLRDLHYEDSPPFTQQLQEDLDLIFQYVSYRDVLESEGELDLSSQMFSVSRGDGPEVIYTLEEVLRYARSQGFYLDSDFNVVNDLLVYDNGATARDYVINWRAYMTDQQIREPGDVYVSLLDLSREVLHCLSAYYKVQYRMIANPSNLYFQIAYTNDDDDSDSLVYTNAAGMTLDDFRSLGRYCILESSNPVAETNLAALPSDMTVPMENNNFYDMEYYYLAIGVDTDYPADDIYFDNAAAYQQLHRRILEALAGLALGCVGCLVTLYYLVLVSGYRTPDRSVPTLHGFDTIATELFVALSVVFTMFALFLGEEIGARLIHLLVVERDWEFADRMMRAVIIYICFISAAFSILRRYKCRTLWSNSVLHHIQQTISEYFVHRSFSYRLFCLYAAFVAAQSAGVFLVALCVRFFRHPAAKLGIAALVIVLLVLDYKTFYRLFLNSRQEDRIADAIGRIADGDTSYQMELDGLSGKELDTAHKINRIGIGLERALQEQVKSERLKADLITNVSHDIKTPLTSIINYVDLMKREKIQNPRIQEYLNVLDQKSQRLKTLTEDLLEASKASSGNLKLEMIRLDLVEMIWQTNGEFQEKFAERQLELVSNLPEGSVLIEADGRHLWRVLENLYNNAFKYAMEHSRVFTDIECRDGWAYFTIKNVSRNPLNVNTEDLVERFVRGDESRTTEGSGLGLSIAQSLTKLQKGTFEILVDGDLFKVRLGFPILSPEAPAPAQENDRVGGGD